MRVREHPSSVVHVCAVVAGVLVQVKGIGRGVAVVAGGVVHNRSDIIAFRETSSVGDRVRR